MTDARLRGIAHVGLLVVLVVSFLPWVRIESATLSPFIDRSLTGWECSSCAIFMILPAFAGGVTLLLASSSTGYFWAMGLYGIANMTQFALLQGTWTIERSGYELEAAPALWVSVSATLVACGIALVLALRDSVTASTPPHIGAAQ